jgi:hypothetical protein
MVEASLSKPLESARNHAYRYVNRSKLKSPSEIAPVGLFGGNLSILLPVRKHSHILAAAVLKNDPFAGLVIDLVSLPARLRHVFGGRLMTVAE